MCILLVYFLSSRIQFPSQRKQFLKTTNMKKLTTFRQTNCVYCQNYKNTLSDGAVGSGNALQAGRSRVRFPMVSLEIFRSHYGSWGLLRNEYNIIYNKPRCNDYEWLLTVFWNKSCVDVTLTSTQDLFQQNCK